MNLRTLGLSSVVVLALSVPVWGHHSQAMYDGDNPITITGTVAEFEWRNPHCWLNIMVVDESGTPRLWTLESNSTGQLTRGGWTADAIKAGDEVSVDIRPMRDGTRGGTIRAVHLPDGRVLLHPGIGGYDPLTGKLTTPVAPD